MATDFSALHNEQLTMDAARTGGTSTTGRRVHPPRGQHFLVTIWGCFADIESRLGQLHSTGFIEWATGQFEATREGVDPHYQAVIRCRDQQQASQLQQTLGTGGIKCHAELCRSVKASLEYVSKKQSATGQVLAVGQPSNVRSETKRRWHEEVKSEKIRKQLEVRDMYLAKDLDSSVALEIQEECPHLVGEIEAGYRLAVQHRQETIRKKARQDTTTINWRAWQRDLMEKLAATPNDRTIYVVYDEQGAAGKSFFAKAYQTSFTSTTLVFDNGKSNDIKYIASRMPDCRVVFMDLTRTTNEYVNYAVIEELKNGQFTSGKYSSITCSRSTPHVVILTNFRLKWNAFSSDRWAVYNVYHEGHEWKFDFYSNANQCKELFTSE